MAAAFLKGEKADMLNVNHRRPATGEYNPYYDKYISLVPDEDVLAVLRSQLESTLATLGGIDDEQANTGYAPGKWSIKELVGHVIDGERVFAYRALRFARGDQTPLNGFEQDDFVVGGNFNALRLSDLAEEFEHVRKATLSLFGHLSEEAWQRSGVASDSLVSVRALAYIMAGHEAHHMRILRERYLNASTAANV
ncbi:MAG: hypothetical protein QOF02_2743 [Blastocatellia bacterium]|nr:hypothetical protein [Blastocatellia bacterium]